MAALKTAGIEKNTLVVFTSDNGPWSMFEVHAGTAGPLRGEKGTAWEGGYRVPGIFHWPGRIGSGDVDGMGANLDLYATFAALTGGVQPIREPGYISKDLSGVLFRGEDSPRSEWLFSAGAMAFRSGKYKIHLSSKRRSSNPDTRKKEPMDTHDPPLLFNLEDDIGEQSNISGSHPEVVQSLIEKMKVFRGID